MVDLQVQLIGAEKGSPAGKNRVCDFENTNVDLGVSCGKAADEILARLSISLLNEVKGDSAFTWVKVSHLLQKSESAMTLTASPSCVWTLGGELIMRPMRRSLIVVTSSCASL